MEISRTLEPRPTVPASKGNTLRKTGSWLSMRCVCRLVLVVFALLLLVLLLVLSLLLMLLSKEVLEIVSDIQVLL